MKARGDRRQQLASALIHEINNKLSGVFLELDGLSGAEAAIGALDELSAYLKSAQYVFSTGQAKAVSFCWPELIDHVGRLISKELATLSGKLEVTEPVAKMVSASPGKFGAALFDLLYDNLEEDVTFHLEIQSAESHYECRMRKSGEWISAEDFMNQWGARLLDKQVLYWQMSR